MNEPAWQHYRVERETEDLAADPPGTKDVVKRTARALFLSPRAALPRGRVPGKAKDVVKIWNRAGAVVASFEYDSHPKSIEAEARIASDLMRMTVPVFRAAYGIADENTAEAPPEAAPEPAPPAGPTAQAPASSPPVPAHERYRVERVQGSSRRRGREPVTIRVLDRDGIVVAEIPAPDADTAAALEQRLRNDLAETDAETFRVRYGISL